jgi:hypothetical protein
MNKEAKENTVLENFRTYWPDRDTSECFFGISILLDDQGWTGKGELVFGEAPTIILDGESWQVNSLKIHGSYELELNLSNKDIVKKICISDDDIEKLEAYKLFQAVFDNTVHEDFDDIEDYYGWYLS